MSTRTFARRSAGAILAAGLTACAPHAGGPTLPPSTSAPPVERMVDLSRETVGQQPRAFVAMTGGWSIADDAGQKVIGVDGRRWTPGVPPADIAARATAVFPDLAQSFADHARRTQNYPFAVARDIATFSDGSITSDFKLIGGETDQYAAILFGLQPDASFLALRYNTKDGDLALWRVVDGERVRLHHGGTPVKLALGVWHTLSLEVNGAAITGALNGQPALAFTIPRPVKGRVGFWTKPDSVTAFRNFKVVHRDRR